MSKRESREKKEKQGEEEHREKKEEQRGKKEEHREKKEPKQRGKGIKKRYGRLKTRLKKLISPVFLMMLLMSLILWYLTKLGYTYTATVPMTVEISGSKIKIECLAEGTGYRIMSRRFVSRKVLKLGFTDVRTSPSAINEHSYVIEPLSLQNAISLRVSDLKIISVGDLPEIELSN